jgi:predicted membrane protein
MKTINDLDQEERQKLLLYNVYRNRYVGQAQGIQIIGFLIMLLGFALFAAGLISLALTEYATATGLDMFAGQYFAVGGIVIAVVGALLAYKSSDHINKRKKKLQLAFQMEGEGTFEETFDVSDTEIEHVHKKWVLGEEKCESTKTSQKKKSKN